MSDANVRVLVSALTEAAEESLEEVGDEMGNLAADGHVAAEGLDAASDEMSEGTRMALILQSALDELGDEAVGAGAKAEFLQNALDEVGDQATQAAVQSQAASGAFSSLSISSQGAALSVGSLSTAFTLSLIPAVLTAATVLAPLVVVLGAVAAGAVAIAGAFGLIVGSGILAFGQQKAQQNQEELEQTERLIKQYESMKQVQGSLTSQGQDRLEQLRKKKKELQDQTTATGALAGVASDLKDELAPLIADFGREFIPLIREAVDAIPDVVEEMLAAVGGTDQFKQALRDFGALAADVLPELVGLMFDLARAALPVLRDLISFLDDNGEAAMNSMQEAVQELAPELMELLDALIEMAPTLLEFGTNVGEVLIPALTDAIRVADDFMETINQMDADTQKLTISVLLLAPALVKLAGVASTVATLLGFNGLTGLLVSMATWLTTTISGAFALGAALGLLGVKILEATGILDTIGQIGQWVGQVFGSDVTSVFLSLISVLSGGLIPLIAAVGAALVELVNGDVQGAKEAFMEVMGIFSDSIQNTIDLIQKLIDKAVEAAEKVPDLKVPEVNADTFGLGRGPGSGAAAGGGSGGGGSGGNATVNQRNETTVNVDVGGDLQQNPYSFSRTVADQVNREKRSNNGA